ncbi:MAG: hypothetical protein IJS91_03175 [Bacteroidales bacterium]|nr:hypothetical protein [Bacteroidales bacterium]
MICKSNTFSAQRVYEAPVCESLEILEGSVLCVSEPTSGNFGNFNNNPFNW